MNNAICEKNNKVYLCGTIVSKAEFSHEVFGEGFYEFFVRVERLSGQSDVLPITISERLMNENMREGDTICALGQFRSYNKLEGGRSRLMLTVFVREVLQTPPSSNPNSVVLSGYICKAPVYRTTPFNREIADLLIAVNRSYNKSDYIPAIAWGRNARFVAGMSVGDKVVLSGRIQSREYQKKQADDSFVTMTAYEVSISKLALYDDYSPFDIDEEFSLYTCPHDEHSHADKL